METIKVWTKQNRKILDELDQTGRYTAKRKYIEMDLQEHAGIMLEVYDWLSSHGPDSKNRPADVTYPVWVSFSKEATMLPDETSVILELEIDASLITRVNIEKWGMILNYSYIPQNAEDAERHQALLDAYGVSDAKAYMSRFYPDIKREIMLSWNRLFDPSIPVNSDSCYGNIWEIKKEWITQIVE